MTEEQAQKVMEALQSSAERFMQWARRVTGMSMALIHRVKAGLWEEYARAGCPYGLSEEGMLRWFEERREQDRRAYEQWEREFLLEGIDKRTRCPARARENEGAAATDSACAEGVGDGLEPRRQRRGGY